MTANIALITEEELDRLEEFLFSPAVSDEALDLIGAHGFLCALNISPDAVPEAEWLEQLFDGKPEWSSAAEQQEITELLRKLYRTIGNDLYNDQEILLPCELSLEPEDGEEGTELTIWAQSFMEGVFLKEDAWFGQDEETVAGLLLPIMVASDLFEDEDVVEISKDRSLREEMCVQIPEVLVDLYLHFHAPDK
ncbi:YecA/YgfB family protein [Marinobacterium weihaiense]|uniref:YecA family protein n=1 Tax=Marinobacterium weihaiense TaxID=2851016 RepID=A0ABS6M9D0_9GAMM|nr:YecA family protein [Marinobacterium weihaiense]MBV0932893.1 YecA family protein [Marinobacterium weihaiense]